MALIEPSKVTNMIKSCLFSDEEIINGKPTRDTLIVKGIMLNIGFDPIKIEKNKNEINSMIENLHPTFKEGWSFLNMCLDKNENLWTGEHITCEELLVLGLATGKLEYTCNRNMWSLLPKGLPYIIMK